MRRVICCPSFVAMVKPALEKSVKVSPDGPLSVRQREKSASGVTDSIVSTVTPQYVASSASSWMAMFLRRPSALRSKHSGSSASV